MRQSDGVCRIKEPFLVSASAQSGERVTLVSDGRTRGMNKGAERAHVKFEGSGTRPTFDGETNFFHGEALARIKTALRPSKRDRDDAPDWEAATTDAAAEALTTDAAEALTTDAAAEALTTNAAAEALTTDAAATVDGPEPPACAVGNSEVPEEAATNRSEIIARLRAERKALAAAQREMERTSADQKRANAAKRDELFRNRLILAPLTTVGNLPYRRICQEFGADNTVSEMAMIYNLNRTQKSEWSLLRRHESEKVFGLQVAVSRPGDAVAFAKAIEASGFSYDYIDINCGCPVDLIVRKGCGCGLWEKKSRLRQVVEGLVNYQSKPVTIKCRIGPDEHDPQLHKHIAEYESWGASAVTIHGRSRKQRYCKLANWSYIEQCAKLTALPVIGNGDVFSHEDMAEHREQCPTVSSAMIARGALIKPWVFQEIKEGRTIDLSSSQRLDMLRKYCDYGLSHWGADEKGVQTTRKFLLEFLSFLHRYVPAGILEQLPQRMNERPPAYVGRDDLETLMVSDSVADWTKISEMLLGPAGDNFKFTPKHKSNSYNKVVQNPEGGVLDSNVLDTTGADEG